MSVDSFDLTDQPWIMVRDRYGRVEQLSIRGTFGRATELAEIVGDLPTQVFAITRLLLAILHRAVDGPADEDGWAALWQRSDLPLDRLNRYLDAHRDRFDLLHPQAPFYQVADLHTARNEVFGLERLIADAPTGRPYFTTRLGPGLESIELAEAARWLIHCQAFDPSGIKSGAVGDERVKDGKGYPIGVAWAGQLGGILCEGRNLRETLLLNLVQLAGSARPARPDLPTWERPPHGSAPEFVEDAPPAGPLQLYTWQSRRIRLFATGGRVRGVLVSNGDKLEPQNRHNLEPMTAWRRSKNQEKMRGLGLVYMPQQHNPDRALWRGVAALVPSDQAVRHGTGGASAVMPGVLSWLGALEYDGLLPATYPVRIRALGIEYINQSALVGEIMDDSLQLRAFLLSERGAELAAQLDAGVQAIEEGVFALVTLASNLAVAAGGGSDPPRRAARAAAYAELDKRIRPWLAALVPGTHPQQARAELNAIGRRVLLDLGAAMVHASGPKAWVGREVDKRTGGTERSCSPIADSKFRFQINKRLPPSEPTAPVTEESA